MRPLQSHFLFFYSLSLFFFLKNKTKMNYKAVYPTNVHSNQSSSEPSAPPIPTQTTVIPIPQYPEYVYRDAIRKRNTDGHHFPINATLFLLGLL